MIERPKYHSMVIVYKSLDEQKAKENHTTNSKRKKIKKATLTVTEEDFWLKNIAAGHTARIHTYEIFDVLTLKSLKNFE